jgi:hypothetical protein
MARVRLMDRCGARMTELSVSLDVVSPHLDRIIPPEWSWSVTEHAPLNLGERNHHNDAEHDWRAMTHIRNPFCMFCQKYIINGIKVKPDFIDSIAI